MALSSTDPAVLVGALPRERARVIEALHRIIDGGGALDDRHLDWVAGAFGLSGSELFEIIGFYDRFSHERQRATIRLCDGPACSMAGSTEILARLKAEGVAAMATPCLGACDRAPAAIQGGRRVAPYPPDAPSLGQGYRPGLVPSPPLEARHLEAMGPEAALSTLEASRLGGLGGAGYPTAVKWKAARARPGPRHVIVNADEGEVGAFKDRHLLETAGEQVLAGALVAASLVGAETIHVYLRDEYVDLMAPLTEAGERLGARWPGIAIEWRRGAGSYVCGEETALIESIEGRPALPRHKPPYPAERGLFGRPTVINNVETLFWVNEILTRGADWFQAAGGPGDGAMPRFYSVSGRVARPGVHLAPHGISLADLLDHHCGGMAEGETLAAFLPGGAAGGILPAALAGVSMDRAGLEPHGVAVGSASVIVLSERDDLAATVAGLLRFLSHESCGQCAPCRLGTGAAARRVGVDGAAGRGLADLALTMEQGSICGLGQGAGRLLSSYLRHFGGDAPR
jgi:formate dehydrogenase